jgi:hypothetical protein
VFEGGPDVAHAVIRNRNKKKLILVFIPISLINLLLLAHLKFLPEVLVL